MAVLLGVLVAASFGSGDFLGGRASRRAPTLTVLMVAQATAVAGRGRSSRCSSARASRRTTSSSARSRAASTSSASACCTKGSRSGRMGVVAPLTAVVGVGRPGRVGPRERRAAVGGRRGRRRARGRRRRADLAPADASRNAGTAARAGRAAGRWARACASARRWSSTCRRRPVGAVAGARGAGRRVRAGRARCWSCVALRGTPPAVPDRQPTGRSRSARACSTSPRRRCCCSPCAKV